MSENSIAGIEADPGAQVVVNNTEISYNASFGVQALGTVALSNSDISFNTSSNNRLEHVIRQQPIFGQRSRHRADAGGRHLDRFWST
jgi:hypothetical protein